MTRPGGSRLIKAVVIINLVLLAFAYTTLLERKLLGRMQLRYGPEPRRAVRPAAAVRRPGQADPQGELPARATGVDPLYIVAPVIAAFTALAAFAVIPFGAGLGDRRLRRQRPGRATSRSR